MYTLYGRVTLTFDLFFPKLGHATISKRWYCSAVRWHL